jgi:hypothetical protein
MGLWSFISKMAQGKPVFEEPVHEPKADQAGWAEETTQPAQSAVDPSPFVDEKGRKIIPQITIERCKSHINGNHMDVTAWLTNTSEFEVELDKMEMIDAKTELDRRLRPHEGHEVTLYRGALRTNDQAHKAKLYYKIVQNGDYFCADFMIEYNRESNGMFTVEEFHPDNIIHDV